MFVLSAIIFIFIFLFFCWYGISPVFVLFFLALVWSCNINLGFTDEFGPWVTDN